MTSAQDLGHIEAIRRVLIRYAELCDFRDWDGFGEVFAPDVVASYGSGFEIRGPDGLRDMVRSALANCGPTQHLLGNFRIEVEGTQARSRCYVRAVHAGSRAPDAQLYEVWGEYADELRLTDAGWRIEKRAFRISHEVGTRELLWRDAPPPTTLSK